MLVIGIDPGTATTGYGLVQELADGSLQAVAYGAILTSPEIPFSERLLVLHSQLTEILLLHRPESSAVEKLFFQRNVRTALSVGHARGVALLALVQQGVPLAEYSPVEVKLAVVGYGAAEKKQVQHMVTALLSLTEIPKPDDVADALAIAICHIHSARFQNLAES